MLKGGVLLVLCFLQVCLGSNFSGCDTDDFEIGKNGTSFLRINETSGDLYACTDDNDELQNVCWLFDAVDGLLEEEPVVENLVPLCEDIIITEILRFANPVQGFELFNNGPECDIGLSRIYDLSGESFIVDPFTLIPAVSYFVFDLTSFSAFTLDPFVDQIIIDNVFGDELARVEYNPQFGDPAASGSIQLGNLLLDPNVPEHWCNTLDGSDTLGSTNALCLECSTLIITEVMQTPPGFLCGDQTRSEWFEVYNPRKFCSISRFTVRDNGLNSFTIAPGTFINGASYYVFGREVAGKCNGYAPVNYLYENMVLSNLGDEIIIEDFSGGEVARLAYGASRGFVVPTFGDAASMQLTRGADPSIANDGSNWCLSTERYYQENAADILNGTPGRENTVC